MSTPTTFPTFRLVAMHDGRDTVGAPSGAGLAAVVATKEDAQAIAAMFPKSVRAFGCSLSNSDEGSGHVSVEVNLKATKVTGSVNEAGIKRLASALRTIERNGGAVEYAAPYTNSYATRDDVRDALGV